MPKSSQLPHSRMLCVFHLYNTPLPLLHGYHLNNTHVATTAHLLHFRKRKCGPKVLALPRLGYRTVELIDLLERKAFSFIDHEVNECNADEAEGAPDEEDFRLQVGMRGINHVGRAVSDDLVDSSENAHIGCFGLSYFRITRGKSGKGAGEKKGKSTHPVQQPVTCGCHTQTLSPDLQREQLTSHNPCDWAPAACEEEDVNAHKSDGRALGGQLGGARFGPRSCNNKLADAHAHGSNK